MSATHAGEIRAEFRAAGTDLSERRRSGISRGPLIDLKTSSDTIGIEWRADGVARIGALTTVADIAGEDIARKIQLQIEYDPAPPFVGGTPATSPPQITAALREAARERCAKRELIVAEAAARLR